MQSHLMATLAWVGRALWQYAYNWIGLLDRACNVLLFGDPRQTISARMGGNIAVGRCPFCGWVCRRLEFFQAGHCALAFASNAMPLVPDMQITGD